MGEAKRKVTERGLQFGADPASTAMGRGAEESGISLFVRATHPDHEDEPNGHDTWGLFTRKRQRRPHFRNSKDVSAAHSNKARKSLDSTPAYQVIRSAAIA